MLFQVLPTLVDGMIIASKFRAAVAIALPLTLDIYSGFLAIPPEQRENTSEPIRSCPHRRVSHFPAVFCGRVANQLERRKQPFPGLLAARVEALRVRSDPVNVDQLVHSWIAAKARQPRVQDRDQDPYGITSETDPRTRLERVSEFQSIPTVCTDSRSRRAPVLPAGELREPLQSVPSLRRTETRRRISGSTVIPSFWTLPLSVYRE